MTDLDGGITSVNRAGLAMLGREAEALVGMNVKKVMGAQLIPSPARPPDTESRLEVGEPIPFTRSDGEVLQLQVSVNLMTDETQSPLGYILNVQDVTLLKKLEEHAERRNRFTAMGEMAANIAHEIRNPLGSIELFASFVKKGLAEQDDKMELVNHISSGIASMNHIISNLLEYTKPRPVSLIRLNLHDLLGEVVEFTRFMADQNQVEIDLKLAAERPWVLGDGEHLKQVFHNLFLNAVQAMPEGGRLVLSTRKCSLTKAKLISRFGEGSSLSEPLDVIEVACRDSGPGIPPEIQRRIFDPFFSTKARGTGLGLAIVHNIIESHRGAIDVESRNGEGTTFILMFPLIPDEGAEQRADGSKAGTGKSPGRRQNP
ncbi:MAG: PAS domain S-box protein [SAR324 cluster bacterium]|nr:PAS domain S-box protein [SAR324 cluster bacterium]